MELVQNYQSSCGTGWLWMLNKEFECLERKVTLFDTYVVLHTNTHTTPIREINSTSIRHISKRGPCVGPSADHDRRFMAHCYPCSSSYAVGTLAMTGQSLQALGTASLRPSLQRRSLFEWRIAVLLVSQIVVEAGRTRKC